VGTPRLIAIIHPENRPSQCVAEKIGLYPGRIAKTVQSLREGKTRR